MARPYALPSLTALSCFETAARHGSFKSAASELNVTPAAVSHQIKALEEELAQLLFRRQHRGVELTEAGAYLFVALQRGLDGISSAVREIRGRPESEDIIIQATTAVSAFWLTPKISKFWTSHPDMVISQAVSDAEPTQDRVDLSIHYGQVADEDSAGCVPLFSDRIVPVGSKEFAARQSIGSVADLAAMPLIHVNSKRPEWTSWKDWFDAFGVEASTGKRITVNNYMIALQLAQDGVGAVLGWSQLIVTLLDAGNLVRLVPDHLPSPHAFYLRVHPRASQNARIFANWISERDDGNDGGALRPG